VGPVRSVVFLAGPSRLIPASSYLVNPDLSPASTGPTAAFTVDVEDYFHVSGFDDVVDPQSWSSRPNRVRVGLDRLLEMLDQSGVRGTFFVLGWVAEREPQLVRQLADLGHELGSHSHRHRLVYRQSVAEFRDDLRQSRDLIEQASGKKVVAYRAPSFSIVQQSLWALEILIEEGFEIDSSIFPIYHDRYGIPDASPVPCAMRTPAGCIQEFPPTVWEIGRMRLPIGGGGYLRIFPEFYTRAGLRAVHRQGRPFQIYVHPWELDPDQPRLPARRVSRLRHYWNLEKTEARLKRLLARHRFGTLSAVLDQYRTTLPGGLPEVSIDRWGSPDRGPQGRESGPPPADPAGGVKLS